MDNYVGKRLDGRYEILEIIGVGGMSIVYKAHDNIDDRIVAVKILKDEYLANEDFRRRFKNESKAIAVLSHPNIVRVYDVSYGDRLQYIVMEYVEGITLKEYIEQKGRINWKESVYFITQILRALQHAHDRGIVHRDIKPQNIILLQNGTLKVTDFGIARISQSETRTMTGSAIGSVHYISPEQARGDVTDNRADIYSAGVVLYEMLTGQLPFQSDNTVSVALMQLQSEAKRPREINPSIPVGLEQITVRAMQKKPHERYQSAAEMLLDIDEFKRNPSVKFDYSYNIDNQPTKFVSKEDSPASNYNPPVAPLPMQQPEQYSEEYEEYYDDEEEKSRTLPIVGGVIGGLLVLAAIIIGICLASGIFTGEKIVVPNFVGKNYYEDIKDNESYKDYVFAIESVESDTYEPGVVSKQSPSARVKMKSSQTITLYIASQQAETEVPDVYGLDYVSAISILESCSLKYTIEFAQSDTYTDEELDKVIRTDPERLSKCSEGATVILYVAKSLTDSNEPVEIPQITGYDVQTATELLESVGLSADSEVKYENSDSEKANMVCGIENYKIGSTVPRGTVVQLIVSKGPSAQVEIKLPNAGGVDGTIKVYLNGTLVEECSNKTVLLDGSTYTITPISGEGNKDKLIVKIDSTQYYECNIDFTVSPPVISNEYTNDYFEPGGDSTGSLVKRQMPSVTGKSYEQACEELYEAGFKYIEQEAIETDAENLNGIVARQNPTASESILMRYSVSTTVTLTVYTYTPPEPVSE